MNGEYFMKKKTAQLKKKQTICDCMKTRNIRVPVINVQRKIFLTKIIFSVIALPSSQPVDAGVRCLDDDP